MITMSNFGNNGRLGNQLFQLASLIGISKKNNTELILPEWKYKKYFNINIKKGIEHERPFKEPYFHYQEVNVNQADLNGFFQSEKYFENYRELIRKVLSFNKIFIDAIKLDYQIALNKPTIAISIRRGDFVNNPNYEQLPITYYILALFEHFPNWQTDYNIILFSDDIEYCKVNFGCLDNVYFATGVSDIIDLALMSLCDNFIISNSTYSWWGAWLGEKENTKIIRPNYLFAGNLLEKNDSKDYYPERWITFDHKNSNGTFKRIDLTDVTFTIPVKYDSYDRIENYNLSISYLSKDFNTKFLVLENQTKKDNNIIFRNNCVNLFVFESELFHRTKMLNIMARMSYTEYIANWDCDIIIPTLQIWKAVNELRNGADMVYPYDGRFARLPRQEWLNRLISYLDIGIIQNTIFNGMRNTDNLHSVGGAVFFNRKSFIKGGMENENFISFGAEDVERKIRFEKLGFIVKRIKGCLYHINHWVGLDSSIQNPNFKANQEECNRIARMTKQELIEEIKNWKWTK